MESCNKINVQKRWGHLTLATKSQICGSLELLTFGGMPFRLKPFGLMSFCGEGGGSVGRAVAFYTRGPQFEPHQQHNLVIVILKRLK